MQPHTPPTLDLANLRKSYNKDGYVILPSLFSPQYLSTLRDLSLALTDVTRDNHWPYVRRVGKQFPPFDAKVQDYWGIQHLMHPSLPHSEVYREFYSSEIMLSIASALLDCNEDQLQMELFNLLINPEKHAFALGWHRDDIRPDVSAQEEKNRLKQPAYGVQWNVALYDDDCLFVVPATHARCRTEEEIVANNKTPPKPIVYDGSVDFDGQWDVDPPQTMRVSLKAGETIFYSQRILHRASYLPTKTRATLHGCYGQASAGQRARMILQHDVDWMKDEAFGKHIAGTKLHPLWTNLIAEYRGRHKEEYGYSLDG